MNYIDKVFNHFITLEPGIYEVNKLTNNFSKFGYACRCIQDWQLDIKEGFSIDFNSDYTKFRKIKI